MVPAAENLRNLADRLRAEVDRLTAWKAEATGVLNEWERTWEAAGRPGTLGQSKGKAVADMLDAINALPDDTPHDPVFSPAYLHGYREAMRQVKALLHPEEGE